MQERISVYSRRQIEREAQRRGLQSDLSYPYVTEHFLIEDWDFQDLYWRHWRALAADDERLWVRLTERLLAQRDAHWKRARTARILQVATTGSTRSTTTDQLLPSWVLRLREQPCLPDTRGFPRRPEELLRRTPETESLMDVESFVHGRLDGEATRELLDLFGVRSIPTGPDRLLDCLRSLAKAEKPPIHEVEKWYRRLDQMVDMCSTTDLQKIREAFRSEQLILAQDDAWATASSVFQSSDNDVPDAAVIRLSVAELALWRKLGVAERPTADLAIEWLRGLPSGRILSQEDAKRVRGVLGRHPVRIWEGCRHWINLAGEWAPVESLSYVLTMQSLIPWRHLHLSVKQKTADLQCLPGEIIISPPFSDLPLLSTRIKEQLQDNPMLVGPPVKREWLATLGTTLRWIELDAEEETQRVRLLAESLARTNWVESSRLDIVPYIDGTPAGTPRKADVLWLGDSLYVEPLPKAKLARRVPEEIGRAFSRADMKAALDYSFERSAEDVREYLEGNFKILPAQVDQTDPVPPSDVEHEPDTQTEPKQGAGIADATPFGEPDNVPTEGVDESSSEVSTGNAEGEQTGDEDVDTREPRPRPAQKPTRPSIIERFARGQGFRKDSGERFFHKNGSWIGKSSGASFPWELRTAGGDLVRYYLPREHCLEREPLQLEADSWGLIEQHPDTYALVLADIHGNPIEVTGAMLRAMREEGMITLYPASYRLVYDNSHNT